MTYTIKNGFLEISVKSFGAVLTSVKSRKSGYEFLWEGNPEIWNGQSPVLFPVIGGLLENKCIIDGREYEIIRHGIARHREFELYSQSENELVFVQREDEETLKSYPFKYELYMSFKLDGNSLTVTHTVKNTNEKAMEDLFATAMFSKAFAEFTDKYFKYVSASNAVLERNLAKLPIPTNKDMNSLYLTVYNLRKDVRDLKRELEAVKSVKAAAPKAE